MDAAFRTRGQGAGGPVCRCDSRLELLTGNLQLIGLLEPCEPLLDWDINGLQPNDTFRNGSRLRPVAVSPRDSRRRQIAASCQLASVAPGQQLPVQVSRGKGHVP